MSRASLQCAVSEAVRDSGRSPHLHRRSKSWLFRHVQSTNGHGQYATDRNLTSCIRSVHSSLTRSQPGALDGGHDTSILVFCCPLSQGNDCDAVFHILWRLEAPSSPASPRRLLAHCMPPGPCRPRDCNPGFEHLALPPRPSQLAHARNQGCQPSPEPVSVQATDSRVRPMQPSTDVVADLQPKSCPCMTTMHPPLGSLPGLRVPCRIQGTTRQALEWQLTVTMDSRGHYSQLSVGDGGRSNHSVPPLELSLQAIASTRELSPTLRPGAASGSLDSPRVSPQ